MTSAAHTLEAAPGLSGEAELNIPRSKANFWFAVLWLIYWFDYVDRNAINAIFPALKTAYNLTDAQLGMVSGIVGLTVTGLGIPVAWLVDKWSRKYLVAIMVAIWSFCTWASGMAGTYSHLILARLGIGAGEAGYSPAGFALVTAWYPQNKRGTMVGIFNMAQPLASFTGVALAGWIAVTFGWRSVFGVLAIPGIILAVLMLFAPDYKPRKVEAGQVQEAKASFLEVVKYCFTSPSLLLTYLGQACATAWAIGGFGTWAPTFFGRNFNLDMAQAGVVVMIIGLVATLGPFLGGRLSDYLVRKMPNGRPWAALCCLAGGLLGWGISLVCVLQGAGLVVVAAFWALGNMCFAGHWGMSTNIQMELVPPHYRGLAQSFGGVVVLIPYVLTGPLTGYLSDRVGLNMALLVILIGALVLTMSVYYAATRTIVRDQERLKTLGTFKLD